MTKPNDKEYESLRSEIIHWQNREITVFNISLTIIVAYVGWLISLDSSKLISKSSIVFSWQLASLFPILLIGISMNMQRIFEFFMLKISTYLIVYHKSQWEDKNRKVSVEKEFLKLGLNNSYALIYFILAAFSTIILIWKFPYEFWVRETILWGFAVAFLVSMTILLFYLRFGKQKEKLIKRWEDSLDED